MASEWFNSGLISTATAGVDWDTDSIRSFFLDEADHTTNAATDDRLEDIAAGARVGTPQAIGNITVTGAGIIDGDDISFTGLTGDPVEEIITYLHTGNEANDVLLLRHDGITLTPDGNDVDVQWNGSGIAQL